MDDSQDRDLQEKLTRKQRQALIDALRGKEGAFELVTPADLLGSDIKDYIPIPTTPPPQPSQPPPEKRKGWRWG